MATTEQKFLDYPGLEYYHQQNIATIDEKDVSVLDNSKSYTDSSVQAKGNELGTRIDNLILNAGDSSAECADARVTKDGTVHDTLKNRLDTEYIQLSSELIEGCLNNNILPFVNITDNLYIDATTGQEVASSIDLTTTDYVEVPQSSRTVSVINYARFNEKLVFLDAGMVAVYDKDKNWIKNILPSSEMGVDTITLEPRYKYIRVIYKKSDEKEAMIIFGNDQIRREDIPDAFPYVQKYNNAGAIGTNNGIIPHNDFGYTDYIEVPKWANKFMFLNRCTFGDKLYAMSNQEYATYDEDKNFIETITGDTQIGYIVNDIDASVVRYIRLNYCMFDIDDCVAKFMYLPISDNAMTKWNGKTGNFLGDSITEQNVFTGYMSSLFGITVNNYGVSGTTISNKNGSNYFSSRIESMNEDCDFIFILGGTNDWGLGATLGTKTDTTVSTFYGGLYDVLSKLRAKFPTKPIFVSTILQRDWTSTTDQSGGIDSNVNGDSIMDFNEAIVYMAHRFGCKIVDGFGESGIAVSNIDEYTGDRLHLNEAGGTRYATFVKDEMEKVTPY